MMYHHQHRHHHDHATVIKNGIHRICMYRDGPDMGACVCASALGVCMRRMRLSMCCVLCFLSCLLREAGCVLCIICFALKLQEEKNFRPGDGQNRFHDDEACRSKLHMVRGPHGSNCGVCA